MERSCWNDMWSGEHAPPVSCLPHSSMLLSPGCQPLSLQCLIALELTLAVHHSFHLRPPSSASFYSWSSAALSASYPTHQQGTCMTGGVSKCPQDEPSHCLEGLARDMAGCSRPAPCPHCHLVQPQCCHGNQDPSRDGCRESRKDGART